MNTRSFVNYSKLIAKHDSLKLLIRSLESIEVLTKLYLKVPQELLKNAYIIANAIAIKVNNKLVTKSLMDNGINLNTNKITNVPSANHYKILSSKTDGIKNLNKGQAQQHSKLISRGNFMLLHQDKVQVLTTEAVYINVSHLLHQLKIKYGNQITGSSHKDKDYKTIPLTNYTSQVLTTSISLYVHFTIANWKRKANFNFNDPFTKQILSFNTNHFKFKPNKSMVQKLIDVDYKLLGCPSKSIQVPSNCIKSIIIAVHIFRNAVSEMYPKSNLNNSLEYQAIVKTLKDIYNLN